MADEKKDRQARKDKWMKFIVTAGVILGVWILIASACNRWFWKQMDVEAENYRLRQELKLRQDQESGLWIPGQPSRVAEGDKIPSATKIIDENTAVHRINCSDFPGYVLGKLKPKESVQVRHIVYGLEKRNRCSFSVTGAGYPIHMPGFKTVPQFQHMIPFVSIPAHATVIFLVEPEEFKEKMFLQPEECATQPQKCDKQPPYLKFPHRWIDQQGGIVVLTNNSNKEVLVVAYYNYSKYEEDYEQFGSGSYTETLETLKYYAFRGQPRSEN